jgi:tRNA-dihydrouridine synthase
MFFDYLFREKEEYSSFLSKEQSSYELLKEQQEVLLEPPSLADKLETMLNHLNKMAFDFGEEQAARQMRKHAVDYLKGVAYASKAKQAFVMAQTVKEYEEICASLSQS